MAKDRNDWADMEFHLIGKTSIDGKQGEALNCKFQGSVMGISAMMFQAATDKNSKHVAMVILMAAAALLEKHGKSEAASEVLELSVEGFNMKSEDLQKHKGNTKNKQDDETENNFL